MLDITLPALPGGAALVLRWLAGPGDLLMAGAPLLLARTDSVEAALPAPAAGELVEILAPAGARVEAGAALARLRAAGEPERRPPARATPLARRIATAHNIDPAALAGSGPDGRVVAEDVRRAAEGAGSPGPEAGSDWSGADRVQTPEHVLPRAPAPGPLPASDRPAPCPLPVATATIEFDAGAALTRASLVACVAAAAAELMPRHRLLNARWGEEGLWLRRRLHLAVARPDGPGLAWVLVRDAGDLTLRGMARALSAAPSPDALGDATFAVVSLADGATWQCAPPPLAGTVAALGLGTPGRRAGARGEAMFARPVAALTLSYDARAIDHAHAAAFLRDLRAALEGV
jgi:pyruvate/2-oxoglutarate dehydrogenase complex dihydrolipoamide acyltransferase (E2) component